MTEQPVDCNAVATAAYKAIFDRDPDDAGLAGKVAACTAKTPWPAGAFGSVGGGTGNGLVGKPWTPAGVVLEFRASAEYKDKKLTPSLEKGGCRHCTAGDKSADCSVTAAPPDDESVVNCVLSVTAAECCVPVTSSWGAVALLVLFVAVALYLVGGVGWSYKMQGKVAIPHLTQWQALGGLVVDGSRFTAASLKKLTSGGDEPLLGDGDKHSGTVVAATASDDDDEASAARGGSADEDDIAE